MIYKKVLTIFFLATILLGFFPRSASADGMIIRPYGDDWRYGEEKGQYVLIDYKNNIQKMLLAIDVNEGNLDKGGVWIFPVPANPQKVVIDVASNMPSLSGEDVVEQAKSNLRNTALFLAGTQIYPIPFLGWLTSPMAGEVGPRKGIMLDAGTTSSSANKVDVYEHLEKNGVTSEVLTAKSAVGLYKYLKEKGINVEDKTIPTLGNYIGKEYSFVVSWIDPPSESAQKTNIINAVNLIFSNYYTHPLLLEKIASYLSQQSDFTQPPFSSDGYYKAQVYDEYLDSHLEKKNALIEEIKKDEKIVSEITKPSGSLYPYETKQTPAVSISFPTNRIYFPLVPTSIYESKYVPAEIRIIGKVKPDVYADIENYTTTEYFRQTYPDSEIANFSGENKSSIDYTLIKINAPSKLLTQDLWIDQGVPAKTNFAFFIYRFFWLVGILLLLIASFISGLVSGKIVFHRQVVNLKDYLMFGVLGLFNSFSIIGLAIAAIFWRTKIIKPEDQELFDEFIKRGYSSNNIRSADNRKLLFLPLFSVIFIVIIIILFYPLYQIL
ncbi:MAG: hypothetical protein Q7S37_00655 [bacterium]|nr:hypothetical protein [bacterium]